MDYGERCLEVHAGVLPSGGKTGKVVVVDDILATGASALACCGILEKLGMKVHEVAMVYDYSDGASVLPGREVLTKAGYSLSTLRILLTHNLRDARGGSLPVSPRYQVTTTPSQ